MRPKSSLNDASFGPRAYIRDRDQPVVGQELARAPSPLDMSARYAITHAIELRYRSSP